MRVRALQKCFVGNSLRKVGDVFDVPENQALRTGEMAPVMERVEESSGPAPVGADGPQRRGKARRKAEDTTTAED